MPATCYRCITVTGVHPPGEPFGVCESCNAFACVHCGNRVPKLSIFKCRMCLASLVLFAGLGGPGPPPSGPGGGGQPGGGQPLMPHEPVLPYGTRAECEELEPTLAEQAYAERQYYHNGVKRFLGMADEYAFDVARRQDIDRASGYAGYDDEVAAAHRADLLRGAQQLARDARTAEPAVALRPALVAEPFWLAQHAIDVPAGEDVAPVRLALLSDGRLRFVVGAAAVATGPPVRA